MPNARLFMQLSTGVLTIFVLNACQPQSQDSSTEVLEETATNSSDDNVALDEQVLDIDSAGTIAEDMTAHDMTGDAMVTDEIRMTDRYQDYTESMTDMHDEMMIGMGYNDPDTAFAKTMLGHHRGAIDMANIELEYGTNADMRKLAQEVIEVQQAEVDIFRKWLASHPDIPEPELVTNAMQRAYHSSVTMMHSDMSAGIADPVADMAFARAMLAHHIGAVKMARTQLKYGDDDEMRVLAKDIISAQQKQIERMQDWIATQQIPDAILKETIEDDLIETNVNEPLS